MNLDKTVDLQSTSSFELNGVTSSTNLLINNDNTIPSPTVDEVPTVITETNINFQAHQEDFNTIHFDPIVNSSPFEANNLPTSPSTLSLDDPIKPWDTLLFEDQCTIEWKDITIGKEPKFLLNKVSGFAIPGKITCIVGTTGAGKTLLMNTLSRRFKGLFKHGGEIFINGKTIKSLTKYRSLVSYVEKQTQFFMDGSLTVGEYLKFAASFKFPSKSSKENETTKKTLETMNRNERVDQLLERLGLKHKEHARISSLSTGEKKKLSVGSQNVFLSRVILIEAPTTDLDFQESYQMMKILKRVAQRGISLIISMQQPTIRMLKYIDYISILHEGRNTYFGTVSQLDTYWKTIGYPIKEHWNPIEYCIAVLSKHNKEKNKGTKYTFAEDLEDNDIALKPVTDKQEIIPSVHNDYFGSQFEKSDIYPNLLQQELEKFNGLKDRDIKTSHFQSNLFLDTFIILYRSYLIKVRNYKTAILGPLFEKLVASIIPGIFFFQIGLAPDVIGTRTRTFLIVNLNTSFTFANSIKTLSATIPNLLWERRNNSYPVSSFYIAKSIEDLLEFVAWPTLFGIILFWLVGLNHNDIGRFFVFILINCVTNLCCMSFAQMLICIIPRADIVGVVAPLCNALFTLLSGIFLPLNKTPYWFIWTYYISYFFYCYRAMNINEYRDVWFTPVKPANTTTSGVSNMFGTDGFTSINSLLSNVTKEPDGNKYLRDSLGIDDSYNMIWVYIGVLFAYFVIYKVVGYLGIRFLYKS
ncbi:hypothetical protein ABK040_006445 [Willaertia magna]